MTLLSQVLLSLLHFGHDRASGVFVMINSLECFVFVTSLAGVSSVHFRQSTPLLAKLGGVLLFKRMPKYLK